MPKIYLKPNSAEYADDKEPSKHKTFTCDMPGCSDSAEFRAPKDRSLNEYNTFCLTHIQEYNRAWDYFTGMAQVDVEDYIVRSSLGDRPTWRYDNHVNLEDDLKQRAWQTYNFSEKLKEEGTYNASPFERNTPEFEAMATMGLEPPLSLEKIKKRYKELAKKYHPDINKEDPAAEDLLKRINMSYTILKLAYAQYEKIEK